VTTYHPRRPENAITNNTELLEIIRGQKYMTLAIAFENEPYLATMNYGYDTDSKCFYFHCAPTGRKVDYLKANPLVWGQIIEDRGYLMGDCNHSYRTVQFKGRVEFLTDPEEKRQALYLMITQLENEPKPEKKRALSEADLARTAVVKVRVLEMSGKMNPVEKEEGTT
jgi:nitroimidazol reductase NimA-like FMN-containing flavoprotein (pyridoxamine 5'-phosphate oxidase superfamily)